MCKLEIHREWMGMTRGWDLSLSGVWMGVQKNPQLSRSLSEESRPLRWKDRKEAFQVERAGPSHRHKEQHRFWTLKQKCNQKPLCTGQNLSHPNNDAERPRFCLIPTCYVSFSCFGLYFRGKYFQICLQLISGLFN